MNCKNCGGELAYDDGDDFIECMDCDRTWALLTPWDELEGVGTNE